MLNAVKINSRNSRVNWRNGALFLCALALTAPLFGAFPGLSSIELYAFGYLVPSQVVIVSMGVVVFGVMSFIVPGKLARSVRLVVLPVLILFCGMGLWGLVLAWLSDGAAQRTLIQILWMVVPLLYAGFLVNIARKRGVRFSELSEITVIAAALFSCVLIVYNFVAYGIGFANGRLYCPGLGPVILGYTNALVIALAVSRKGANALVPTSLLALSVAALLVSTILTGSRGGMYPALVLSLIYFLPTKNAAAAVLFILGAMAVILLFNPMEVFLSGRAGDLQSGRYATWDAAHAAFSSGPLLNQFLGYGLGNVFPFQDWYTGYYTGHIERGYTDGAWNSFSFRGNVMLVEPHNTYIWLLLEGGVLSLVGFVICLLLPFVAPAISKGFSRFRFAVVLATFMFLGVFDAVVFVNAASAFWWGILLVACESSIESGRKSF